MKNIFFVLSVFSLLSGCATTPTIPNEPIQDTIIIDKSYNTVWKAVINVVTEFKDPIKVVEKDSGLITTDFVIYANGFLAENDIKRLCYLPKIMLSDWVIGKYFYTINISKIDESKTQIKIITHLESFEKRMTGKWYLCESRGVIENNIFNKLREELK